MNRLTDAPRSDCAFLGLSLESCRSVDPQEQGFLFAEALPPVRPRTLKVQTVTRLQRIAFHLIEPDFQPALKHIDEFFPLVAVGAATAGTGRDAEKMRLHHILEIGRASCRERV